MQSFVWKLAVSLSNLTFTWRVKKTLTADMNLKITTFQRHYFLWHQSFKKAGFPIYLVAVTAMCLVEAYTELHVQSLWGSVSGLDLHVKCEAEKKRQIASKATKEFDKTSTFYMNISLSRRHHPFICPSIHPWPQQHTYIVTTVEVLGQWL